jgi:hypothetical protein
MNIGPRHHLHKMIFSLLNQSAHEQIGDSDGGDAVGHRDGVLFDGHGVER